MDYRDLLRQHVETGADMTIAAVEQPLEQASRFGVLQVNDRSQVASFSEKPENPSPIPSRPEMALTSMGVYVFKRSALAELARWPKELLLAHDFGRDVIPLLISSGKVYVYNFRDEERDVPRYWRDIGTIDSYYEASMDLTGQDPIFDPYANYHRPSQPTRRPAASESVQRAHRPRVALDSRVRRSVLSPDVEIAGGVYIERSILLPGVRIGEGAHLRRVIVEEGVEIPAGVRIGFDLDKDRERHAVTGSGVVVVNKREPSNRIGPHAPPAPIGRRSGLRQVHWINV
jgi:glucose-1-phosphate adenylyltransferase